ncbi:DNA methyltransferase [soil metagenome]
MSIVDSYLAKVEAIWKTGSATEHSYRSALEYLFHGISPGVRALNEPKRVEVGAPDFIVQVGDIVVGHVEAKDLPVNLRELKGSNKEQQQRYLKGLPNLIYTNGLSFEFFRDGERIADITVATLAKSITRVRGNYDTLEHLLKDFISQRPQTITSPRTLAVIMAGKAALIKDVLANTLAEDEDSDTELANQFRAFREHLIHDITVPEFSDIYAETVAYGMFAARLHDTSPDSFTRLEALELLPKSNPFLRSLFGYIAGPNLDDRIRWILDDLADAFQACDVRRLMEGFGKLTGQNDPFLHFYETFLAAYNPDKRKARGVWYTPEPVVRFIVRAVDEVLQREFGLSDGLADTSKITVDWDTGQRAMTKTGALAKSGKNAIERKEVHRVQILDPATGTGTFLAEVIKQIAPKVHGVAPGMWSNYIEKDLIPRVHGFELLMASYAMCHIKLDMTLTELGYTPTGTPPRLGVYLTNSLEEGEPANQTLPFAQWLSNEVKQANAIKRDMPIMCVIGNPPYSGISLNMGEWIVGLIDQYKFVDGVHFGERKHWLHDDYVKFIRLSEHLIEKNQEGVLGFITNHGYLDNPTFRGMRWHLLKTFEKIYVIDLHGNANKQEVGPDGLSDKNIFDIRQGVSIIIAFRKKTTSTGLATVYHTDIWGAREDKNRAIEKLRLSSKTLKKLSPRAPYYMFYDVNLDALDKYDQGFMLSDLFPVHSTGIISARDELTVDATKAGLTQKIKRFLDPHRTVAETRSEFFGAKKGSKYLPGDSRGWRMAEKRPALQKLEISALLKPILYRPFDNRWMAYHPDIVDWPRNETMGNFPQDGNIALLSPRMTSDPFSPLVTDKIISNKTASRYDQTYFFPLYIDPVPGALVKERTVNLSPPILKKLQQASKRPGKEIADEFAVFDYVYGVLHAPTYRKLYSEFLRIDFPRIPWPSTADAFWGISEKGKSLRELHLMQSSAMPKITGFPFKGDGDGEVVSPRFEDGKIWVNSSQYFDAVPEVSWSFFVGGYQPAQKWLKDRKGSILDFDDVKHYQKVLFTLAETARIMSGIAIDL